MINKQSEWKCFDHVVTRHESFQLLIFVSLKSPRFKMGEYEERL